MYAYIRVHINIIERTQISIYKFKHTGRAREREREREEGVVVVVVVVVVVTHSTHIGRYIRVRVEEICW